MKPLAHDAASSSLVILTPVVKHYPWGMIGAASRVARLAGLSDPTQPCAELWIGAHPSGAATARSKNFQGSLRDLINTNPELWLGSRVAKKFTGQLPFLLKILSINTALSIQTHPHSDQALKLHHRDPKNYPDSFHKPEIAVALTKFRLLRGFRATADLQHQLAGLETAEKLFGAGPVQKILLAQANKPVDNALRDLVAALLQAPAAIVEQARERHRKKILSLASPSEEDKLFVSLLEQYPGADPGPFFVYLLQLLTLNPGQALYTPPGVLHAYLDGEIIECMANSDNVVRAGLTNKYKDLVTLLEIADWDQTSWAPLPALIEQVDPLVVAYPCPAPEFTVQRISQGFSGNFLADPEGPQLFFCLEGHSEFSTPNEKYQITRGQGVLAAPGLATKITVTSGEILRVTVP